MGRFDSSLFYTLANGIRVRLKVSREVKHFLVQTKRQYQAQERKNRRYNVELDIDLIDIKASSLRDGLIDLIYEAERYNRLYYAINKLPEIQQRRLKMYYFDKLTYNQIAQSEGVTFKAVAKAIENAKESLKFTLLED